MTMTTSKRGLSRLLASILVLLAGSPALADAVDTMESEAHAIHGMSFDPALHGASTLRGATWHTPKTRADTQTSTGLSFPAYQDPGVPPEYYGWGCHVNQRGTSPIGCVVNEAGTVDVAVVGSSYIGQWMPAILNIAEVEDWRVTIYTKT